ncbi:MAG: GIY-YIG nuclease family protein [Patescibacteria group bacterium]
MYYIYLLRCSDHSLYCGQTKDLKRRVSEHNSNNSKSKYTRSRRPVKLVYFEKYKTISEVLKRESEIKRMNKPEKEILIKKNITL